MAAGHRARPGRSAVNKKIIAAFIASAGISFAGGLGTIEGTVVDGSGAPVASGVRVEIVCGSVRKFAVVDGSGNFNVSGLPEGTCTITGSKSGLAVTSMSVAVSANAIS